MASEETLRELRERAVRQLGGSKYSMTDGGDGQLKTTDGFEVTVQRTGVTVAKRNDGSFSYLYATASRSSGTAIPWASATR